MSAKNITFYLVTIVVFLLLTTVLKGWIDLLVIPLWIGGFIGVLLPEIDHLIYAYFLRPQEFNSQRIQRLANQGHIYESVKMGTETRIDNKNLVFHNLSFQIIFLLFSVFVVTSTGSLLGRGIVIGFLVNLVVDQFFDLRDRGSLSHWVGQLKLNLTKEQTRFYVLLNVIAIIVLAIFL